MVSKSVRRRHLGFHDSQFPLKSLWLVLSDVPSDNVRVMNIITIIVVEAAPT